MKILNDFVLQGPPMVRAGRACLGLGALAILSAGGSLLAQWAVGDASKPIALPPPLNQLDLFPQHRTAVPVGQAIVGALILVVGFGLVRSRLWARSAAMVGCFLGMLCVAAYIVVWCRAWFSSPTTTRPAYVHLFALFGLVMLAFWFTVLAWCARYLNRAGVPHASQTTS